MLFIEFETEDGEYRIEQFANVSMQSGRYLVNGLFVDQETFFQVRRSVVEAVSQSHEHVIVLTVNPRVASSSLTGTVPL